MTGFRATLAYELRMQLRRPALWVLLAALVGVMLATQGENFPTNLPADRPLPAVLAHWALTLNLLAPLAGGVLLADRLIRDHRLGVAELLAALPAGVGARLWGKYLGATAATAAPTLLAMLAAGSYEAVHRSEVSALGWAVVAFALINLPGLVFVGAFALLCPVLVSVPLFRVLFVGYWFWGNLVNPDLLPTMTGTLLAPVGDYAAAGLLGGDRLWAGWPGFAQALRPSIGAASGVASIGLLLAGAAITVLIGQVLLARRSQGG